MSPAGDKTDPFPRKWLSSFTSELGDLAWTQLTYEQRGIYDDLERFSLRASDTPGFFLYDGEPMTMTDIVRGLAPTSVEEAAKISPAMQVLRERKLITYDEGEGWSVTRWASRQLARVVEIESARKEREGAAKRKRKERASGEPNITRPPEWFAREAEPDRERL